MILFALIGAFVCMWSMTVVQSRELINGDGIVDDYLVRWHLLKVPGLFSVYLHWFTNDDWSIDKHDHPKRFWTIGLRGSYIDESTNGTRTFVAPWFRSFPPEYSHRLVMLRDTNGKPLPCWTLCIVGRLKCDWGWWVDWQTAKRFVSEAERRTLNRMRVTEGKAQVWVRWDQYVYNQALALSRRAR